MWKLVYDVLICINKHLVFVCFFFPLNLCLQLFILHFLIRLCLLCLLLLLLLSYLSDTDFLSLQIRVREGGTDWGWGVVVNVVKKPSGGGYIVDTLLHCSPSSNENSSRPKPCPPRPGEKGEMHVVSSRFEQLSYFSVALR